MMRDKTATCGPFNTRNSRDVLPELPDGTPDPRNLEIKNITTPLFSYTDPVNTYLVCHKVMVHRGELAPSISPGDCTVFLRGDCVVDGWTKVYHIKVGSLQMLNGPGLLTTALISFAVI